MKTLRLFITTAFILCHLLSFAQSKLADSKRQSSEIHIYKISKDDLRKIYLKEDNFQEEMLNTFVTKYNAKDPIPTLSRGNYVTVRVVENQLVYREFAIDNLYAKIIPSEKFVICLYDSLGNIIKDAEIKRGTTKLKYDKETQTYITNKIKDEQIVEIAHNGVYHYWEVSDNRYDDYSYNFAQLAWNKIRSLWYRTKYGIKNIFTSPEYQIKDKYTGFIVFNKPKYKPNETVKLKAYLTEHNGKRYNKPIDIKLNGGYKSTVDTILTHLEPYQPGMYSYEFKLTEALGLTLDKDYSISLLTSDEDSNDVNNSFKYEDYELKSLDFSLKADKEEYILGDSIKLNMKITDENNMAVYDGKIEVLVTPEGFDSEKMAIMSPVFIPDTLWNQTINMSGISEKELIIPDSIFPLNNQLRFKVQCTYLSIDNEKQTKSLVLSRSNTQYTIDYSLNKGMLTIKELYQGKSQPIMAKLIIRGEDEQYLCKDSVMLPHTLAIPWHAADISVETKNTKKYYFNDDAKEDQLGYKFYRNNDSIYLKIDNPANIPFWYKMRKMKKVIAQGYTTQLNYGIKDIKEDGYNMQLSYLFGGESKTIESTLPFVQKNITIDVTTPTTVYPGQKANVQVAVSDKKGHPVKDVDITAYSFTSKFKNYSMPHIPIGGKARYATQFRNIQYEINDNIFYNKKSNLTKERWANTMSLDTIEYYKFLYPDTYYVNKIDTKNGKTQISPFVVINGEVQGVHMLWIDERLYYTSQSEDLNIYSFEIESGKHSLRFRTYDREILALNFYLEEGKKHVMSFNGKMPYTKIPYEDISKTPFVLTSRLLNKKEIGYLSDKEAFELQSQLITVDNNFGEIELPNISQRIDIPGYISTGNNLYYLNHTKKQSYNYTLRSETKSPILAGPFPRRNLLNGLSDIASVYAGENLLANIEIEGGNHYILYPDYQKIKQWNKSVINRNISAFKPSLDFIQQPLTNDYIKNRVKEKIKDVMCSTNGFVDIKQQHKSVGIKGHQLKLSLGKDLYPTLIFIEPKREEDRKDYQLFYGKTRTFNSLPTEDITIHLIFNDSTSFSCPLKLYKGGQNYLRLDSIARYEKNTDAVRIAYNLFAKGIKTHNVENPYISKNINDSLMLSPMFDSEKYNKENKQLIRGIVRDNSEPIIGAFVKIKGSKKGIVTNFDGEFEIDTDRNVTLEITCLGYKTKEIKANVGYDYNIVLKEDQKFLEEAVVIGYGTVKKSNLTSSVTIVQDNTLGLLDNQILHGKVAGLMIRGTSSIKNEAKPLIIVKVLPFDGNLKDINTSSILSLNVLKDTAASSIYGARAANGVIMIETNILSSLKTSNESDSPSQESGNTMRRNFHDDAFWQPKLRTDEKGEVNFEVTYPDDITNWNAYFIALGGKKQSDTKQISIRSFKALSARLSTPRFAIQGDSLNVVGRVANHFGDSLQLNRTVTVDNKKIVDKVKVGNSLIDHIPVKAIDTDSITLAYSLQMENGYFDGEERSFPILEKGMLQTYGDFKVINDSSTYTLNTDSLLGDVIVHAEASSLELFLREIESIDKYPYMCNEQIASKIKALLAKKYIFKIQGKEFKEDKKINSLINDLNKNKNKEGLWGWWNKSESVMWISKHIINALLDAEDAGYKTDLNKESLSWAFRKELKDGVSNLPMLVNKEVSFAKGELLDRLIFLKRLNAPINYKSYLYNINSHLKDQTVKDKLKTMLVMSSVGLQDSIKIDSLIHYSNKTILGSRYWGDTKKNSSLGGFYHPYETNSEYTLLAYQILKNMDGYEKELESIRNYFFEQRQNNKWNNTYESSSIIQTIMTDMLTGNNNYKKFAMNINNNIISEFPYTTTIKATDKVRVSKTGTMPLFITAYQKNWNKNPIKEKGKGFDISTIFKINGGSIADLKEGKSTILETTLNISGDAEYVQIEIPIPAGCTYDSKPDSYYWKEEHREYYKEKVVIFCNKLPKGEHIFSIELLPKYTGRYSLNPAKAELMYFPTFYGNEEMKIVEIK